MTQAECPREERDLRLTSPYGVQRVLQLSDAEKLDNRIYRIEDVDAEFSERRGRDFGPHRRVHLLCSEIGSLCQFWQQEKDRQGAEVPEEEW